MATQIEDLRVRSKYRVIYRSGNKTMALVGTYLGVDYKSDMLFDLRPEAGTTPITKDDYVDAAIQPGHFKHRLPYRWSSP